MLSRLCTEKVGLSDAPLKKSCGLIVISLTLVWDQIAPIKLPPWNPDVSLEFMERSNIGFTILSIGPPGADILKNKSDVPSFCREINTWMSKVRDEHPARFGFFATLPSLLDVENCLEEIAYALDVLKADGIILTSSYGDGKYLGHADFRRIWDDLDHREAVVLIHPHLENMVVGALKEPMIPRPILDFAHETTRTAVHLIVSNTIRDHQNCKIILSHGGGTLPYLASRIASLSEGRFCNKPVKEFVDEARGLYYDAALSIYELPLRLLLAFAEKDHVLFGSDFPFGGTNLVPPQLETLDMMQKTDQIAITSLRYGAALKLFPRLMATRTSDC